jgi:hypothetical protein
MTLMPGIMLTVARHSRPIKLQSDASVQEVFASSKLSWAPQRFGFFYSPLKDGINRLYAFE